MIARPTVSTAAGSASSRVETPNPDGPASAVHSVVAPLIAQAEQVSDIDVAIFVVESGVCVFVGGNGPVNPSVVGRTVAERQIVADQGMVAIPILLDDELVAVATAPERYQGEDALPRLVFMSEIIVARLRSAVPAPSRAADELDSDLTFRPLFEAANFVLLVLDAEGTIRYANPYVERLTGFPASYLVGRSAADPAIYSTAPSPDELAFHQRRISDGAPTSGEATIKIASGEYRTFSYTLSPVRDDDGKVTGVLGSAIDITERREAEHRLHIANEALEQARVQAENSADARSDFLAQMSHEIRTPLNAIIGTTTLMLDEIDSDIVGEHTEILRSSADHLLSVINDILDITKLDTGTAERDDDTVFSLEALLESSLDLVMGTANTKGLEVTSYLDPGVPTQLRGDAPRVRQVLVNLLSNAVKYTAEGVVQIVVRGHYVGQDRVEVVFEIADTGPGISTDRLSTMFDPFVRGDLQDPQVEGSGLGLSISERLVHMLDGTISAQSVLGEGTRFTVTLPCGVEPEDPAAIEPITDEFAGLDVLIVDDLELNRMLLEVETRRLGMRPTRCASARDALAMVAGGRSFDVALIDLIMPDMDGDELAEMLKERTDFPRIAMSGSPTRPELFAANVAKPIKRHHLVDAIRRAIASRTGELAPPEVPHVDEGLRILLAEDNIVNQKVADALLRRLGHIAVIVGDGTDALAELERRTYDLVILDLRMPHMDGIETASEIIARYGDDRPRVVALTASATEEDRQRCYDVGMDDFVTKPITLDGLASVLAGASVVADAV